MKYHELIPVKSKSLTDKVSLHDNLIIHGDNLKALKALLPLYAGKVKCIYIDPPYNTGNEKWTRISRTTPRRITSVRFSTFARGRRSHGTGMNLVFR